MHFHRSKTEVCSTILPVVLGITHIQQLFPLQVSQPLEDAPLKPNLYKCL